MVAHRPDRIARRTNPRTEEECDDGSSARSGGRANGLRQSDSSTLGTALKRRRHVGPAAPRPDGRKNAPAARALRSPRSLGFADRFALIRVGRRVSRCVTGESVRTRIGTPAVHFSTLPLRPGRIAPQARHAFGARSANRTNERCRGRRRRSHIRASARCGQPATSVLKNGLQAFPTAEAPYRPKRLHHLVIQPIPYRHSDKPSRSRHREARRKAVFPGVDRGAEALI